MIGLLFAKDVYFLDKFGVLTVGFCFLTLYVGEFHLIYFKIWWWDLFLHFFSTVFFVFLGFLFAKKMNKRVNPVFVALFAFCFAFSFAGFWECYEFFADTTFGLIMLKEGLVDTFEDLILSLFTALVTSLIGYYYLVRGNDVFSNFIKNEL